MGPLRADIIAILLSTINVKLSEGGKTMLDAEELEAWAAAKRKRRGRKPGRR